MTLLLPRHLMQPIAPPVQIGVFLTLDQLGGPHATMADLTAELAKLKRSEVIRCIAAISSRLLDPASKDEAVQFALANELLSDDLLAGLRKHQRTAEWRSTIFHRRQLSFLLQVAVGSCNEESPVLDNETMSHVIGRVCLMANTILHENEPQQSEDKWKQDYHFNFLPSFIRILDQVPQMEVLARAYMLWFELPKLPVLEKHFRDRQVPSFAPAFEAKYGLSLERFFLIVLSLWGNYQNQAASGLSPPLIDSDQYLTPVFGKVDVDRAMQLLAQTPDSLARSLAERKDEKWIDDLSLLMAHPIMEVFPGKYACPDICSLHRFLTERIYFLLRDAYSNNRFQELFGYVFEEYINSFIGQFGVESDLLRNYWRSPKFVGTTDEACDGLLYSDGVALVMENKARLLMLHEKYSGNPELAWRGVQDIVGRPAKGRSHPKGIFQLTKNIARMFKGEEIRSGRSTLRLTDKMTVIPAMVTYDDAVSLGAVRRWADACMREALAEHGVEPKSVGQLLIFNTHDIERLEALVHKTELRKLILDYAEYAKRHCDDPIATFDVFSFKSDLPAEDSGTSLLAKTFTRAMAFAQNRIPKPEQETSI